MKLREALKTSGISQAQLAAMMGVSEPQVSRWCNDVFQPNRWNRAAINAAVGFVVYEK